MKLLVANVFLKSLKSSISGEQEPCYKYICKNKAVTFKSFNFMRIKVVVVWEKSLQGYTYTIKNKLTFYNNKNDNLISFELIIFEVSNTFMKQNSVYQEKYKYKQRRTNIVFQFGRSRAHCRRLL